MDLEMKTTVLHIGNQNSTFMAIVFSFSGLNWSEILYFFLK